MSSAGGGSRVSTQRNGGREGDGHLFKDSPGGIDKMLGVDGWVHGWGTGGWVGREVGRGRQIYGPVRVQV